MAKILDFGKIKKIVEHYHKTSSKTTSGYQIDEQHGIQKVLENQQKSSSFQATMLHCIYKSSTAFLSEINPTASHGMLKLTAGNHSISLTHLYDLDISLLKSLTTRCFQSENNCWETSTSISLFDEEMLSNVQQKIQACMQVEHIELPFDSMVLIETGGKYAPSKLDVDSVGRVIVSIPSQYSGGELIIDQTRDYFRTTSTVDLSQNSNQRNWIAVFGDSWKGSNYVTCGSQLFIIYNIKFPSKLSLLRNPSSYSMDSMSLFKGLIDTSVQQHFARLLARAVISTKSSFGLVLSENYSEADYPLESLQREDLLKGTDKVLVQTLKQVGCLCWIQPVMVFRKVGKRTNKTVVCPLSDPLLPASLTPRRELEILNYPFFLLHKIPLAQPPDGWTSLKEAMKKEGNLDLICQSELEEGYAFTLAVVVEYPKWFQQKLLLLAWKKNNPSLCPLASLPLELLKVIWNMVTSMDVVEEEPYGTQKKRKRLEHAIFDWEGSSKRGLSKNHQNNDSSHCVNVDCYCNSGCIVGSQRPEGLVWTFHSGKSNRVWSRITSVVFSEGTTTSRDGYSCIGAIRDTQHTKDTQYHFDTVWYWQL